MYLIHWLRSCIKSHTQRKNIIPGYYFGMPHYAGPEGSNEHQILNISSIFNIYEKFLICEIFFCLLKIFKKSPLLNFFSRSAPGYNLGTVLFHRFLDFPRKINVFYHFYNAPLSSKKFVFKNKLWLSRV